MQDGHWHFVKTGEPTRDTKNPRRKPAVIDRRDNVSRRLTDSLRDDKHRSTCSARSALDDVRLADTDAICVRSAAKHEQRRLFRVRDETQPARRATNTQDTPRIRDAEGRRKSAEAAGECWLHMTKRVRLRGIGLVALRRVVRERQYVR